MNISKSAVLWNLTGLGFPILVAICTIPPLLSRLGRERFGLLSLAWSLTAVAGLFDFGVGRAATLVVARYRGRRELDGALLAARASGRLALTTGAIGAALFVVALLAGVTALLSYSPALQGEVIGAAFILVPAIPLQASLAAYRGVCEAHQAFRGISIIRAAMGAGTFGGSWIASLFSADLRVLVAAILLTRIGAWFSYRALVHAELRGYPAITTNRTSRELEVEILKAGGWFTVSSIVSPILVQADRFVIGAVVSPEAVPTYSVPAEMVLQLLVFSTATSTVLFPNLAALAATDPRAAWRGFLRALAFVVGQMTAIGAGCALVLPYVLPWWVGNRLPPESVLVGQLLCIGVVLNSAGIICMAFVHAQRWFRATALAHVAELALYVPTLLLLLRWLGVPGAAVAWSLRVGIDTLLLFAFAAAIRRMHSDVPDGANPLRSDCAATSAGT